MADGVLEQLVPGHGAGAHGVDAAAGGPQVLVLLHQIHQERDGGGLEVDVAVQCQDVRVFSQNLIREYHTS